MEIEFGKSRLHGFPGYYDAIGSINPEQNPAPFVAGAQMRVMGFKATGTAPSGMSADPDMDGRNNLVEYYTGTNPLVPDVGGLGISRTAAGWVRVSRAFAPSARVSAFFGESATLQSGT